jgi:hypothetical protein
MNVVSLTYIVLQNLVLSTERTTALDGGGLAVRLFLDRECILAHSRPPDIRQGARALAVDTFDLVGSDDAVGKRGAVLKHEDRITVPSFFLAGAAHATIVHDHAAVERLSRRNSLDSAKS